MQSKMASKCGVIFILSLLLLIPLMLIKGQIAERQNYQNQVEADIARSWTGRQLVSMPILVQPYQIQYQSENTTKVFTETRFLYQVASNAQIHVNIATEYRQRGIYKVPVYLAKIDQQGGIDLGKLQTKKNTTEQLNGFNGFEEPYLTIHVSDPRGLENDLTAKIHNESHELLPGSRLQSLAQGFHIPLRVQITNITSAEYLHYHLSYSLRGMVAFGVLPSAQSLNMEIQSDWQHPNFNGSFLPRSRTINSKGFSAFWSINPFSSGMNDSIYGCTKDDCSSLLKKAFGVHLIEPVNIYLQAERAVKYGILIVVVCFERWPPFSEQLTPFYK